MNDSSDPNLPVVLIEPTPGILAGRRKWQHTGRRRPEFAEPCGLNEESVWDFPRPPATQVMNVQVEVRLGEVVVASSASAKRVCETAGAPTWYLPPEDVNEQLVTHEGAQSVCEWKGVAQGFAVGPVVDAGWRYVQVFAEFSDLYLWYAFYPGKLECFVAGERVRPQPGGYYGGWVVDGLKGPIKGEPGSSGW